MSDKKLRERRAGFLFIEKYNKLKNRNFILESEEQKNDRGRDPVPDLVFYDGENILNVEEVSLWDMADIFAEKAKINGIGKGSIRTNHAYYYDLITQDILNKNYKCDILLINGYKNRLMWNCELKGFDIFSNNNLDLQGHFRKFFKEVWVLDGNQSIRSIFEAVHF
ncbi:hypothetical protein KJ866_00160 [Patescibacteria group bacterium]|nr:hypothetical protein [Patescibacteria group bacterium]MBU2264814.1 hypothetical protein [Patescibacteria group bacterium]